LVISVKSPSTSGGELDNTKRLVVLLLIGAIFPLKLAVETIGGPNDFSYFWNAARSALYGSPTIAWFPYPPHALFLYLPFAPLPFHAAWAVFNFYGLALFVLAARPYLPKGFPPLLAICTPAVIICVVFGQTGLVVGALWLWAFRGRWQAVAVLTFKPHLGILSALSLNRRTLLPTVLLAGALILASVAVFPDWWAQIPDQILRQSGQIGQRARWNHIGVGPAIGYGFVIWAVFAAAALYLLARDTNVWSAATAALLVSPYGFHYDMPVASLGFALALCKEQPVSKSVLLTLALWLPVLVQIGAWVAPPILMGALWAQTSDLWRMRIPARLRTERHRHCGPDVVGTPDSLAGTKKDGNLSG